MKFYSTKNTKQFYPFQEVVFRGLAPDGGLFMPESIPVLPHSFFENIALFSFQEISFQVAHALLADDLTEKEIQNIIEQAINFDAPIVSVNGDNFSLELFHGPTLAFKDYGARFMARLLSHFVQNLNRELTILVATSGDTGSAVGNGFFDMPGIRVFILYPSQKISHIQEQQLTTMGQNVTALEIEGSFDDCQKLVKQAFVDTDLTQKMNLTSANSINIARLIPQSFYYMHAYAQLADKTKPTIFSVPSGNFGDLTGGLIAKKMGLPVEKFIAATNINDVFPKYLQTGNYEPKAMRKTISNAMDVGAPSNFSRVMEIYGHHLDAVRKDIWSTSTTDDETRATIKQVFNDFNYILDPHGAVGYLALERFRNEYSQPFNGIFLETAHPAKFLDIIENVLQTPIPFPERLQKYMEKKKESTLLGTDFDKFKEYLFSAHE